ncbi:pseudaminic acid synthase [Dongia sp.]|uniref:pseudaminic acid synthase n=1 Tax=Dongia sp. TaxID=1977262 RepID=UPI003753A656
MGTISARTISIGGRKIGPGEPPYIIAEMSANHNGSLDRALAIVEMAKASGADAIKLQTYKADTITIDHDGPEFLLNEGLWAGRRLYELYQSAAMPWEWHAPLFKRAKEIGIQIFSSAFDATAVDLLQSLDAPAYKVASLETGDVALIQRIAAAGKPMIISTGASEISEIEEAVAAARAGGCKDLILLQCTSGYPTPASESNLRTIPDMAAKFDCLVGLSDHTYGTAVPVAAVALGACAIEKHVTLRRADGGVDSDFSLEPEELKRLVDDCRTAFEALGRVHYQVSPSERAIRPLRRSLYVVKDLAAGEAISEAHIRSIRPGKGLAPKHLKAVLGKKAAKPLKRGQPLDWSMVES